VTTYLRIGLPSADLVVADLVVDQLWSFGAVAIHEDTDPDGAPVLTTAFDADVDLADVEAALAAVAPAAWSERVRDDETWWDTWRAHAAPVSVGDGRLVVVPAWLPPPPVDPAAVVVTVEPARTFGSGAHATTRLALELMVGHADRFAGARVLDVGCGSGVLSVVAARLGAAEVVAVDVDPDAVSATLANAAANGVAHRVRAGLVTDDAVVDRLAGGGVDLVLANVLAPVLAAWAPQLVALAPRAVVVSGFLAGDHHRACAHFAEWAPTVVLEGDGWSACWLSINRELAKPN
jgi:ribosomal protein L11 methyltransferase